ncbi:tail assembly chaperone [Mycobacterium phage DS6A]|uniref:Tail assembly chaperone n=1 Tax=Mycobacterium phage DS6A TaxID=45764 RepID=G8I4C7_9CAUD|nr:tail assembly chaperone [Mycobacterium phage DS6A]AER47572.1 tail assembly chaperone [Mycobacterium phage DS6A]
MAAKTSVAVDDSANLLEIEVDVPSDGTIDGAEPTTLRFRSLAVVPVGILRRTRKDQQEQMWAVFEWALPPAELAKLDELPADKLVDTLHAMQRKSGVELGGILDLADLIRRHGEALESDLIDKGLRLRHCPSDDFNWRDLRIIVEHSGVESELFRAMHPEEAGWTPTNMLLAAIVDVLRWLQWARTKDGQAGRNMPEPIKRPGVHGRKRPVHPKGKGAPRSRIRELLRRGRPAAPPAEAPPSRAARLTALFAAPDDDGK